MSTYLDEIRSRRVCSECIPEKYLSDIIDREGLENYCSYCAMPDRKVVPLDLLIETIGNGLLKRYCLANEDCDDGNDTYEFSQIICSELEIDEIDGSVQLVDDIAALLEDEFYTHQMARDGESPPFESEGIYTAHNFGGGSSWSSIWYHFVNEIKKENRFFSKTANELFDKLFSNPIFSAPSKFNPLIREIGPNTSLASLFRAREFQSEINLKNALCRPDKELSPPPANLLVAGRMNAPGITVFYGATTPELALAEVRPVANSRAVIAEFEILKPLRLLDLTSYIFERTSLFDPNFLQDNDLTLFLRNLGDIISTPVMPNDQAIDYLPTQAFADYLASKADPPVLDGILYPSSLGNKGHKTNGVNVVLFHKASRVLINPESAEICANCGWETETGFEVEYHVWDNPINEQKSSNPFLPDKYPYKDEKIYDSRDVTLRIKIESLIVHHITDVQILSDQYKVSRS